MGQAKAAFLSFPFLELSISGANFLEGRDDFFSPRVLQMMAGTSSSQGVVLGCLQGRFYFGTPGWRCALLSH